MKIRSSRPEVFYKEGVLRNFAKVTEKHLCQSLFFNKVTGLWLPPVAASENFGEYIGVVLSIFLSITNLQTSFLR